jgi:hypothetical protein
VILRKQGHLGRGARILVKDLDGAAPRRPLGAVDLSQIQDVALHHPPVGHPAVLHQAPIAVFFAVFLACLGAQEHADSVGRTAIRLKDQGRHYRRFRGDAITDNQPLAELSTAENATKQAEERSNSGSRAYTLR